MLWVVVNSFIPGIHSDEGGNDLPVPIPGKDGDKLTSFITLTGNYDKNGKFDKFTYKYAKGIGESFDSKLLRGSSSVSGKTNMDQDYEVSGSYAVFIEQHTQVNAKEKLGLLAIGSAVDVNQIASFTILPNGQFISYIGHGVYPSVEMTVNGFEYYKYSAQSYVKSHAPATGFGAFGIMSDITQNISDQLNAQYRVNNCAIFRGFTSAPNGWGYSKLTWFKY